MKVIKLLAILILILQSGCLCKHGVPPAAGKVIRDGEEMLWGRVDANRLFTSYPEWKNEYDNYQADTAVINDIKTDRHLAAEIFFATWCEDSQREVPRFLKINDLLNIFTYDSLRLYAVDRNKQLADDLCSRRNIVKVATFIFYRSGSEIGRITEYPQDTLENDMKNICTRTQ